jgi:hypothetical protein
MPGPRGAAVTGACRQGRPLRPSDGRRSPRASGPSPRRSVRRIDRSTTAAHGAGSGTRRCRSTRRTASWRLRRAGLPGTRWPGRRDPRLGGSPRRSSGAVAPHGCRGRARARTGESRRRGTRTSDRSRARGARWPVTPPCASRRPGSGATFPPRRWRTPVRGGSPRCTRSPWAGGPNTRENRWRGPRPGPSRCGGGCDR